MPAHWQSPLCCRRRCRPDDDVYHTHTVTGMSSSGVQHEVDLIPCLDVPHPLHLPPVADAFRLQLLVIPAHSLTHVNKCDAQTPNLDPECCALRKSPP